MAGPYVDASMDTDTITFPSWPYLAQIDKEQTVLRRSSSAGVARIAARRVCVPMGAVADASHERAGASRVLV